MRGILSVIIQLLRGAKKFAIVILFLAMAAFNIATLTVASVNTVVTGAISSISNVQTVYGALRSAQRKSIRRNKTLTKEVRTANLETRVTKRELATARNISARYERRIEQLTKEVRTAKVETRAVKGEITATKKILANYKQKFARKITFRGEKILVSEAVRATRIGVRNRIGIAATRNVGSLVGEAIPFFGIAITVGVVGLDMRDYCKNMKDMDELALAIAPQSQVGAETGKVCGLQVPSKSEIWQKVKDSPRAAWSAAKEYVPDLPKWKAPGWWSWFLSLV